MIGKSTTRMRLCPHCANSIAEDATNCSYCKTDLLSQPAPQWLNRNEPSSEPRLGSDDHKRYSIPPGFIWTAAMLVTALIDFYGGVYILPHQLLLPMQAHLKQLQAKNQMIQSHEAQLAHARQQLNEHSNQLTEMKTKFEESQKELSAMQRRLGVATHEVDRLKASRSVAARRTASSAPDTAASFPAPMAGRRTPETGVYETTRETAVYENPSSASHVISQRSRGTRIHVVSSSGNWLEVRSTYGNPPGYVRSDDARLIGERTDRPAGARAARASGSLNGSNLN